MSPSEVWVGSLYYFLLTDCEWLQGSLRSTVKPYNLQAEFEVAKLRMFCHPQNLQIRQARLR
jgi:hypothetical protein